MTCTNIADNGGAIPPWLTSIFRGVTSGIPAKPGFIGEGLQAFRVPGDEVNLPNGVPTNLLSLTPTAGEYLAWGSAQFIGSGFIGQQLSVSIANVADGGLPDMLPNDADSTRTFGIAFCTSGNIATLDIAPIHFITDGSVTKSMNALALGEGVSAYGVLNILRIR